MGRAADAVTYIFFLSINTLLFDIFFFVSLCWNRHKGARSKACEWMTEWISKCLLVFVWPQIKNAAVCTVTTTPSLLLLILNPFIYFTQSQEQPQRHVHTHTDTYTHTLTDVCFIFNLCLSTVLWVLWLGNKCWVNMCEQDDIIRRQKTFGIWCCCIHMRSEALEISKSELQTDFQTHVFRASQTEHVFTMNCGIFCQRFSRSASDLNKSN